MTKTLQELQQLKPTTVEGIKTLARDLRQTKELEAFTHCQCLELAAKQAGCRTFAAARHVLPLG